jgi:hypothetical protein
MPRHSLEKVRAQLLRAGISPGHVNRYIRELEEHLTDLIARERGAGLNTPEAEAKARNLLGTDAQLVQAMIDRSAPRSLAARAPWAIFGVVPLVLLVVATALLARWSMSYFFPYRELAAAEIPESVRTIGATLSFIGSYVIGPALAALCVVIALRQRLSSRWVWVGLALIALVFGPIGFHVLFLPPEGGTPGGIHGSAAQIVFEDGHINAAATLATMGVRTVVLFAVSALVYGVFRQRVENEHA